MGGSDKNGSHNTCFFFFSKSLLYGIVVVNRMNKNVTNKNVIVIFHLFFSLFVSNLLWFDDDDEPQCV